MRFDKILSNNSNQWLHWVIISAIGLLVYGTVLVVGVPSKINQIFLAKDSLALFIASFLFLYLAYLPRGWLGTLTSFSGTLVLFALQLSVLWRSLISTSPSYVMAGLLPMNDAQSYYLSALRLLEGDTFNLTAARRPMAHGLLATLLGITQQNLQFTLIILVFITATACFFFAREIQHSHGTAPGVLVLTLMFMFDRPFIGTVATENLGLALGAVGFALLWRGVMNRGINTCLFGLFLLTLALNARAGAFLILPAILLWGIWRGTSRFSWQFLLGGFSAIFLGFAINALIFKVVNPPAAAGNSNFAYTLYGLVVGGDWTTFLADYPEFKGFLRYQETSDKAYQLAFEIIRANPLVLVKGCLRAWKQFLLDDFVFSFVGNLKVNFALQILSLVTLIKGYRQRQTLINSFLLCGAIGVLLSLPFAPPWDSGSGGRVYAATIPFFCFFPSLGFVLVAQKMEWHQLLKVPQSIEKPRLLWLVGIGMALLTIVGPIGTKILSHPPQFSEISCPSGSEVAYFRNSAGSSLNIVPNRTIQRTYVPTARLRDFKISLSQYNSPPIVEITKELARLKANTTLISKINLNNNQGIWIIADSKLIPKQRGIVGVCGQHLPKPNEEWLHGALFYADSMTLVSH